MVEKLLTNFRKNRICFSLTGCISLQFHFTFDGPSIVSFPVGVEQFYVDLLYTNSIKQFTTKICTVYTQISR